MKIYIFNGEQEQGPFSKSEIFALMKEGKTSAETLGRWENESEWKPINEVLTSGTLSFLTPDQIDTQQKESPAAPIIVPQFISTRAVIDQPTPPTGRKGLLALGAVALVIIGCSIFLIGGYFHRDTVQPNVVVGDVTELPSPIPAQAISQMPKASVASPKALEKSIPVQIENLQPQTIAVTENAQSTSNLVEEKLDATPTIPPKLEPPASESVVAIARPIPSTNEKGPQKVSSESLSGIAQAGGEDRPAIKIDPFASKEVTENELLQLLRDRFAFVPPSGLTARPFPRKADLFQGSFVLDTNLKWNPRVEVLYTMPRRSNGSPGPFADNIVFQGNWPGAMEPYIEEEKDGKKVFTKRGVGEEYLCDQIGCTKFTLLIHTPREIWEDPKESYFLAGKEWVDIVFRAQQEIIKRHRLKAQKLILYGHSLGGTFVQRIAAARPELVAAAVIEAAPDITLPKTESKTAWFLLIARGDSMRREFTALYNDLFQRKQNVVFNVFPPNFLSRKGDGNLDYHSEDRLMIDARNQFMKSIIDPRNLAHENNPRKWPCVRDRMNPIAIFESVSKQAKNIPEERREYLPSKAFAQCLQALPARMQTLALPDRNGRLIKCATGLPPLGKPTGIAVYMHRPTFREIPRMIDNINYLAGQGYLVVAPQLSGNEIDALQAISDWILRTDLLQPLPLAYVGWGDASNSMWDAIARMQVKSPAVVATIDFKPKSSLDESGLSAGCGVKCPALFAYNQTPITATSTIEETQEALDTVKTIKAYVEKCKKRGQFARIAIAAANAKTGPLEVQQAINQGEDFVTKVIKQRLREIDLP